MASSKRCKGKNENLGMASLVIFMVSIQSKVFREGTMVAWVYLC